MSGPDLHEQQRAAVTRRSGSVALSAGAGCGKTTVLIARFLEELDPARRSEPGPRGLPSVVAITFTDKATREMTARVRQGVAGRLADAATPADRAHWRDVLRRLDTARVHTIHGFCTDLLRANAAEAGLDPGFRVVQGTEAIDLRHEAVDAALKAALAVDPGDEDEDPDAPLPPRELIARCGLDALRDVLRRLTLDDLSEWEDRPVAALAEQRAAAWAAECFAPLRDELLAGTDLPLVAQLLAANVDRDAKWADNRHALLDLCRSLPGLAAAGPGELRGPLSDAAELCKLPQLGTGKKGWREGDYDEFKPALVGFRDAVGAVVKAIGEEDLDFHAPARVALGVLPLARDAAERYARAKRDGARLDFPDLLRKAAALLDRDAIRDRAAGSIRLLMVDEFQDTDPVQAAIVRRLALLDGPHPDPGRLFLVGDAKQSIYRFRGADPGVFAAVRRELPDEAHLPLTRNYRSRPEILRFVNALFGPAMGADYEPLEPPPLAATEGGVPTVEFLLPTLPNPEGVPKPKAEKLRTAEAKWVAARVRALVDSGEPVVREKGEVRPANPGDVCLLFRALTDVRLYEDALREVGLDCDLAGGRSFFAAQEVQDLVHLLLWLDDPDDTLSLAGVLRSPLCGLSDDTLFTLCDRDAQGADAPRSPGSHAPLTAAILGDAAVPAGRIAGRSARPRPADVLRELAALRDRVGAGELVERAVERTGYDGAVLLEFLGERKLANLRKLLRMAADADAAGAGGLRGFAAQLLESVKRTEKEAEAVTLVRDPSVVTLMTVHAAKGLEFPVVVACDLDRGANGVRVEGVLDPELGPIVPMPAPGGVRLPDPAADLWKRREAAAEEAETVRVFYVAATRAADRLILSSARVEGAEPTGVPLKTLAAAFDLDTGEAVAPSDDPLFAPPAVFVHREKPSRDGQIEVPPPRRDAAGAVGRGPRAGANRASRTRCGRPRRRRGRGRCRRRCLPRCSPRRRSGRNG